MGFKTDLNLFYIETSKSPKMKNEDRVSHPSHYTWLKKLCGIEVIDITRHMDFDLGNVVKYVLRSGYKEEADMTPLEKQIEDLKKAAWYLNDKITQLEKIKQKSNAPEMPFDAIP